MRALHEADPTRRLAGSFWASWAGLVLAQALLCFWQVGDHFVRGHNGFNSSAYLLSARNTLRWDVILPVQYYTGRTPPTLEMGYTHHPLGMHLHHVASVWFFGDSPAALRFVPAIHGVLVVAALVWVVARLWTPRMGLLAGLVYVLLPINGIYANMANHSSGFIAWALLGFLGYALAERDAWERAAGGEGRGLWRNRALQFGAFFFAMQWDWPAYYMVFAVVLHWFASSIGRARLRGDAWWKIRSEFWWLAAWSVYVLLSIGGHFWLTHWLAEGGDELLGTFQARQSTPVRPFGEHLLITPPLMFTWPVLALVGGWLASACVRIGQGRLSARDLIAVAFGLGGAAHYVIFKWSAQIHSYWAWTMLPFFAIALADTALWIGERVRAALAGRAVQPQLVRGLAAVAVAAAIAPLAWRSVTLVPKGRSVAGSMWFVTNVRSDTPETYDSNRTYLEFALLVRERTTRATGVILDNNLAPRRGEVRFDTTLDRAQHWQSGPPGTMPRQTGVTDGWVYVADSSRIGRRTLARLAADHPVLIVDDLVMVDLRSSSPGVEAYRREPRPPTLWEAWWISPWEPQGELVRDEEVEADLVERAEEIASR